MVGVDEWLERLGLGEYAQLFAENDIDLDVLPELTEEDLRQLGISLGHRRKLLKAIAQLGRDAAMPPPAHAAGAEPASDPERRQLTVMFVDLVGSTALSTRLDPEDLRDLIQAYQTRCTEIVVRFGGYVGNFIGDGMLVYFGYPQAHEDDPQRAVRAGLEIVEAIGALGAEVARADLELGVRIGINTGVVVAGDIGTGEFRDRRAIVGETPNVAARLQALAEPMSVVISRATQRLVEGLFILDDLGPHEVRGIEHPVQLYRARGTSRAQSRFEASATRGLTPLVGREEESGLLLSRWQRAKEGEGQVVLISGEAGVGKSRLVQILRDALRDEPHIPLRYFCSPFYTNTAFYPFLDQLERAAGMQRHDPPAAKLDKLEALLGQATERPAEAAAILASLMAIPTAERYPPLDLTPQQHKAKAIEILTDQLAGLARRQPVLVTIEDVHWIDPSSAELLHWAIDRIRHLPVLVVMAFRPDFQPPWGRFPNTTSVVLSRLSHRQAAAMVERVTGGKPLPAEVLDQIVARTDGVPLFVEELTKAILETGVLEDAGDRYVARGPLPMLAIPASLQDSLMARLDRLAPVKELAQIAATLGRIFSHELLAAVAPLKDPALSEGLAQLIDAELLYRRGSPPEALYDFKHALLQDAAYGTLLRSKRSQLHARVGEALETHFPETAEAKPELLGHHFAEAGLPARAIPYAIRAGDLAVRRYAAREARARYQNALDMARALPASDDAARWQIDATLKLASVAHNREQFEADLDNLARAESLAEGRGDRHAIGQIRYWIGRMHYVLGHFDAGVDYAQQALEIGEALGADDTVTAAPVNLLARLHCLRGEPRAAIAHAKRNIEQMRGLGNRIEEAAILGVLAFAYGMHGEFEAAFEAAERGVELANGLDHLPTLAACHHFRGVVHGWYGDLSAAVPSFEQAIAIAEQSGDVFRKYLAHGWRGEAYLWLGRIGPARSDLEQCLALGDQIGTAFHRGAFEAFVARLHLLEGEAGPALATSEQALSVATDTDQAWSRSIALRVRAEALAAADPPRLDEAEAAARTAIAIQSERECRFDLAWSYLSLSRLLTIAGDEAAKEALANARDLFAAMGMADRPGLLGDARQPS